MFLWLWVSLNIFGGGGRGAIGQLRHLFLNEGQAWGEAIEKAFFTSGQRSGFSRTASFFPPLRE